MEKKANKNSGLFQTVADKFSRLFRREKQPTPAAPAVQEKTADVVTTATADVQPTLATPALKEEMLGAENKQEVLTPVPAEEKTVPAETKLVPAEGKAVSAEADNAQNLAKPSSPEPDTKAPVAPRKAQPTSQSEKPAPIAARILGQRKRLHISDLTPEEAQDLLENFVTEHLSDEMLSVETMAAQLKVSRTGLYQLVHDNFGMTPANYIMSRRLEHARKLLAEGRKVREVSMKCGFSDPKYFSKVFKKAFSVLPSNFAG